MYVPDCLVLLVRFFVSFTSFVAVLFACHCCFIRAACSQDLLMTRTLVFYLDMFIMLLRCNRIVSCEHRVVFKFM
jgi:hypothetical protein